MKSLSLIFAIFLSFQLSAQCPQTANTSANGCLYLEWTTPPAPLPTLVGFSYSSGAGTSASPAVYIPGGGCGANKGGFSGSFTISGGPTCTYVNGVLPVKFYDLSVKMLYNNAVINFSTLTEINNYFFEIERSIDGITFETISIIPGAGNSHDRLFYTWTDHSPINGYNYYRIKQTDFDGKSTFSNVISIFNSDNIDIFEIRPTLVEDQLHIQTSSVQSYNIKIMNAEGKIMSAHSNLVESQNIDVSHYPVGFYFVTIHYHTDIQTFKIIKN